MNKKSIISNVIGFSITFTLIALIFINYDNSKGIILYSSQNISSEDIEKMDFSLIKTLDFVLLDEPKTIYEGISEHKTIAFSIDGLKEPINYKFTVTDGQQTENIEGIIDSDIITFDTFKGSNISLEISPIGETKTGTLYVYAIDEGGL